MPRAYFHDPVSEPPSAAGLEDGSGTNSVTASSGNAVRVRRPACAGPAHAIGPEPPVGSMSWGYPAGESRHEPAPQGPAARPGGHSREARAAFLLQHGWGQLQQQPLLPIPGVMAGEHHKASARFGSPIHVDPRWQPSREVRMPARRPPPSAGGTASDAGLPRAAAGDAQLTAAGPSASGVSVSWRQPLRSGQLHHLQGQLSTPSEWDVARAATTPASVNQPTAASESSRWDMPFTSPCCLQTCLHICQEEQCHPPSMPLHAPSHRERHCR